MGLILDWTVLLTPQQIKQTKFLWNRLTIFPLARNWFLVWEKYHKGKARAVVVSVAVISLHLSTQQGRYDHLQVSKQSAGIEALGFKSQAGWPRKDTQIGAVAEVAVSRYFELIYEG